MTRRTAMLAAVFLTAPIVGMAHEGHEHKLMGTVTAVQADGNRVEIKTVKGDKAAFLVNADTKFLKGTSAAARTALTPGTRVVAEGKMVDNVLVATTVRIGGAAETATPKASPRPAGHPH
jgi:hypothetical protein